MKTLQFPLLRKRSLRPLSVDYKRLFGAYVGLVSLGCSLLKVSPEPRTALP
jgi:hypothetical protein